MFETMWTFKTRNFEVLWEIDPDESCFLSKVSILYRGAEIAADYLGESVYDNPHDFRDHFGIAGTKYGSYFSCMVRNAVKEARKHFLRQPRIRNAA